VFTAVDNRKIHMTKACSFSAQRVKPAQVEDRVEWEKGGDCMGVRCDSLHSVTRGNRVMNRSSLGKGKDRQQVVVGKSRGKSDPILYRSLKSILYILLGA
jgi:hypothetical protein